MGQQFCQSDRFEFIVRIHDINDEIIFAEFPHHLTADTAGRERTGNDTVLAAADRNGSKIPLSVGNCLEKGRPFGADRRAVGCVLDIAAGVYCSVITLQSSTHRKVGLGYIGHFQHIYSRLTQFLFRHIASSFTPSSPLHAPGGR